MDVNDVLLTQMMYVFNVSIKDGQKLKMENVYVQFGKSPTLLAYVVIA